MNRLRVFVASSTEGKAVAGELQSHLQAELGNSALVEFWPQKFAFGETPIESLESVANDADFAVIVMTPDDVTVSREVQKPGPRDNLVFEHGLFIGALGRERSIVARDGAVELKLPSDILGVLPLVYSAASSPELTESLKIACVRLAEQIRACGVRPKWLARARESLAANAAFSSRVEGQWWEKITHNEGSALSCFTIAVDPMTGHFMFDGKSWARDGEPSARWNSDMTKSYPQERRIHFLWRGKRLVAGTQNLDFHGYGTMEFAPPDDDENLITEGTGDFWDVNQAEPGKTVFKPAVLRRVLDENHLKIMKKGTDKAKRDVVLEVMNAW